MVPEMSSSVASSRCAEPELLRPVQLCTPRGRLNRASVGWSRRPLHTLNLSGHWGRKKRWNYWCITDGDLLFSVTLSSLDYVGVAFAYLWHRQTGDFTEQTVLRPFGRGCHLPDTVEGNLLLKDDRLALSILRENACTRIEVMSRDFGGTSMTAEIVVEHPDRHDTLNVVIPWNNRAFQFTSKQHCLPASGIVRWADRTYRFESSQAFACLDFGRGIWPYHTTWNWGACSTRQQGHTIGLNLGGQWTDGTGMTENGLVVDGRLHKIGDRLCFEHTSDLMQPWTVRSLDSDRVALTFAPMFERVARSNVLLVASEVHQMLGHFTGRISNDEGTPLTLEPAFGWVEEHSARW
jgi:hypothetical protein